jgi:hypothetical protein
MNYPTLLERAKPQLLKAIANMKEKYPSLGADAEKQLLENFFTSDLRWGTWVDIRSAYAQTTGEYVDNPYELFI